MSTAIRSRGIPPISPYLVIVFTGLLAFLPVSSMLFAVKNDLLGLEYPINYFISESLHHGQFPVWLNTWDMGFPLSSCLTWGIYSTPQMIFSGLFPYNIWILQVELLTFIVLCGVTMFYLLKRHIAKDPTTALLLAIAYMLSGFTVAATQWMPYLAAAAFIPLLISALLDLFKRPGWFSNLRFAFTYLLLLTSSYPAFVIVASYGLFITAVIMWFRAKETRPVITRHLLYAGLITLLLCTPVLLSTLEVLQHLDRGKPIDQTSLYFTENYFHPRGLETMLFPFAAARMTAPNTEATMLHLYMGLLTLLLLPVAVKASWKQRSTTLLLLPLGAVFFLLVALGTMLPLRDWLNYLPGFSYFRHAGNFRFFSILLFILYVATATRAVAWKDLLDRQTIYGRLVFQTGMVLLGIAAITTFVCIFFPPVALTGSLPDYLRSLSPNSALFLSAAAQVFVLLMLCWLLLRKKIRWTSVLLVVEMVFNTLACTPYFTVSSYTPSEINHILARTNGFPVQNLAPSAVPAAFTDTRGNTFYNLNVFSKKISSNESYFGALYLEAGINRHNNAPDILVASWPDTSKAAVTIYRMDPTAIDLGVVAQTSTEIQFAQNYFRGWHARCDDREIPLDRTQAGLAATAPVGNSKLSFRFSRPDLLLSSLLLNALMVLFGISILYRRCRRTARN